MPSASHERYAAVKVLGTRPRGRFYRNMFDTGLAADTLVDTYLLKEPGLLLGAAEVRREDSLSEAVETMLRTLRGAAGDPPTAGEVHRAKTELAAGFEAPFKDPVAVARMLALAAMVGDCQMAFLHRDRPARVRPADVLAVAKAYLRTSNRTVGNFLPTDETPPRGEIPPPPDVAALVSEYKGGDAVLQGEPFEPTPDNIESRTTRLTPANGVKLASLPKESRGDAVVVSFTFPHGTEEAQMSRRTAAKFAGRMLLHGTTRRSGRNSETSSFASRPRPAWTVVLSPSAAG